MWELLDEAVDGGKHVMAFVNTPSLSILPGQALIRAFVPRWNQPQRAVNCVSRSR